MTFKIGQTLDNGALVIAARPDGKGGEGTLESHVILALTPGWKDGDGDMRDCYVTWIANKENGTFWGHYHHDIAEAALDYETR